MRAVEKRVFLLFHGRFLRIPGGLRAETPGQGVGEIQAIGLKA